MQKKIKLAILGSTRGTDMQSIIDAIKANELAASIEIVISNKSDAYILERAKKYNIKTFFIDPKGKTREKFDQKIMKELDEKQVDLILLIGYMRILSAPFVQHYKNKILNIHPSLLPTFAGGMDIDVHEKVLKSGVKETGCTVHFVDEGVDTGKILIQKTCAVEVNETVETLKAKVQKLEGEALVQTIRMIQNQR